MTALVLAEHDQQSLKMATHHAVSAAKECANVVDIFHRRATWLVPIDRVGIELILEVRDIGHGQTVIETLRNHGYGVEQNAEWGA